MLENVFEFLITQNIEPKDFTFSSLLLMIPLTILIVYLRNLIKSKLNTKTKNNTDSLDQSILTMIQLTIMLSIYLSCVMYIQDDYGSYLESQLTKKTYNVTEIKYDGYVITSDNKKIKNEVSKTQVVTTPTTDKNKVGKSYYTIDVYKPEEIKTLVNSYTNKYKNQLIQHIYISKKEKE